MVEQPDFKFSAPTKALARRWSNQLRGAGIPVKLYEEGGKEWLTTPLGASSEGKGEPQS